MYSLSLENKSIAQRLLQKYSYGNVSLEDYSLRSMLVQTYAYLGIDFKPTKLDIEFYAKVLDTNQDGKITLSDLDQFCKKVLPCQTSEVQFQIDKKNELKCQSNEIINNNQVGQIMKSSYYNSTNETSKTQSETLFLSHTSSNYQKLNENSFVRNLQRTKTQKLNFHIPLSIQTNYQIPKDNSSSFHRISYNDLMLETRNLDQTENQNFDPYIPRSVISQNYSSVSYSSCIEHQIIPQVTKNKYPQDLQKYLQAFKNIYIKNTNKLIRKVTYKQAQNLLSETYTTLGIHNFTPSQKDISIWMNIFHPHQTQQIQYIDYQNFVVYMLEKQGIKNQ